MKSAPKCIDLFAGAGGLSLGLEMAGWATELAVEFDKTACATYRRNFEGVQVIDRDVRGVDWSHLRGSIDLVAGGPPCQPFSVAGNQKANTDSRDMLPEFVRAVIEIEPELFLMENVAGLASKRHLPYLKRNIALLEKLGYNVNFKVLNAAHFGVPQERLRVFVIGSKRAIPNFPEKTHGTGVRKFVSSNEALQRAAKDEANPAIVTFAKKPVLRASPWAGMLVNGGGRPINLTQPSQTIPASAGGNRTHIVDNDGILLDYHAHLVSGGTPRNGLVKGVRRLTASESASLQSFPNTFEFEGRRSAQYRQIGNAVPPLLAKAVGLELLAAIS